MSLALSGLFLFTFDFVCCLQGLTKAWLERDQMALGVFPNCHECQQIDFPVLKKTFGYLLVDRKPMGFWKFQGHQARAVALRHVRYLDL